MISNPNTPLPPPPTKDFLNWVTQHPDEVAAALQNNYALSNLTISVTFNGITMSYPVRFSGSNAVVTIPLS